MEINEDGFLEELLSLRKETWEEEETNPPLDINGLYSTTSWPFNGLDHSSPYSTSYNSFTSMDPTILDCPTTFSDFCIHTSSPMVPSDPALFHAYPATALSSESADGTVQVQGTCKSEPAVSDDVPITAGSALDVGVCIERSHVRSSKMKKIDGQPSKNLMAERRRRKRLNDRLSMLRSVVPKISKMDRTSILGDTIEYMKELRDKINSLQGEIDVGIFNDVKPNDVLVRNSPKFDVERREMDTRVEMSCAAKPGLLLSTLTTLEALGLEIQHCVISCFNDFSLHASCSQEREQRNMINSEEIKQALFRNAGYGGRCL